MDLSVIILNWNSKEFIDECLQSVSRTIPSNIRKEIIVVDNGSKDDSVLHIRKEYANVVLIENNINRGVAPARNQGLMIARGKYILILDVDTIVHDHAIEILIQTMENDDKVGLCGPKLVGSNGNIQYSCREFPTILSKAYRQLPGKWQDFLLKEEELRDWDHDSLREVGYVIGACQLIRKKTLDDVGILDPKMFYGVEEVDLCLRFWKEGWKVIYNPESVVTHVEQRLGRKRIISRLQIEHIKSLMIYFWKHRYIINPPQLMKTG